MQGVVGSSLEPSQTRFISFFEPAFSRSRKLSELSSPNISKRRRQSQPSIPKFHYTLLWLGQWYLCRFDAVRGVAWTERFRIAERLWPLRETGLCIRWGVGVWHSLATWRYSTSFHVFHQSGSSSKLPKELRLAHWEDNWACASISKTGEFMEPPTPLTIKSWQQWAALGIWRRNIAFPTACEYNNSQIRKWAFQSGGHIPKTCCVLGVVFVVTCVNL